MEKILKEANTVVTESTSTLLTEMTDTVFQKLQLVLEENSTGKKWKIRGEFAKADVPTANKRIYPRSLWEKEISRLLPLIQEGKVTGEVDHPKDGTYSLARASHKLTHLELLDDGTVVGEAEVLDTIPYGYNLKALILGGVAKGISSRGFGQTRTTEGGMEEVLESYKLLTFDFVADPADTSAYPEHFYESKEFSNMTEENKTKFSEIKEDFNRKVAEASRAKEALDKIKVVLGPYVLSEETGSILAAKEAEIVGWKNKVESLEKQLQDMEEETTKLISTATEASYKYYLERLLAYDKDAEIVRNVLGSVTKYGSVEDIKAAVDSIKEDLDKQRQEKEAEELRIKEEADQKVKAIKEQVKNIEKEAKALEEQAKEEKKEALNYIRGVEEEASKKIAEVEQAERVKFSKLEEEKAVEIEELTGTVRDLHEALEKSLEANRLQSIYLHAMQKLQGNPRANAIMRLIEASNPSSIDDIDAIIEANSYVSKGLDIEAVRKKAKSLMNGRNYSSLEEAKGSFRKQRSREEENYNGLGFSLSDLKKLSGI